MPDVVHDADGRPLQDESERACADRETDAAHDAALAAPHVQRHRAVLGQRVWEGALEEQLIRALCEAVSVDADEEVKVRFQPGVGAHAALGIGGEHVEAGVGVAGEWLGSFADEFQEPAHAITTCTSTYRALLCTLGEEVSQDGGFAGAQVGRDKRVRRLVRLQAQMRVEGLQVLQRGNLLLLQHGNPKGGDVPVLMACRADLQLAGHAVSQRSGSVVLSVNSVCAVGNEEPCLPVISTLLQPLTVPSRHCRARREDQGASMPRTPFASCRLSQLGHPRWHAESSASPCRQESTERIVHSRGCGAS